MTTTTTLPVLYIPHGGGPWPFVDLGFDRNELQALADYLKSIGAQKPKALLVISAHWEESKPTVTTSAKPGLLYDYYGFPPESYTITWPVPGAPSLANRVRALLSHAGIQTGADDARGLDHGTFVPLKLAFPDADVPVVQLSLVRGLDPKTHLAMGKELAVLRDEGVLIVGSGMSYHNMRGFNDPRESGSADHFDAWLHDAVTKGDVDKNLAAWESAPAARRAHPREEHLLPLMVVAGARRNDPGKIAWSGPVLGKRVSAVQFG